jgi:hypothetical protein
MGNTVQEKYVKLFWGLPSLHREPLVATVFVPEKHFSTQPEAVAFNTVSNSFPVQHQAEGPPQLSQALQLPQEIAQTQLWTQTLSKSVAQVH